MKTPKQQAARGRRERRISQLEHRCALLLMAMRNARVYQPKHLDSLDTLDAATAHFNNMAEPLPFTAENGDC